MDMLQSVSGEGKQLLNPRTLCCAIGNACCVRQIDGHSYIFETAVAVIDCFLSSSGFGLSASGRSIDLLPSSLHLGAASICQNCGSARGQSAASKSCI